MSDIRSKINPVLTLSYILEKDENKWFDRKSARVKVADIAPLISAFANADGGTIVLGIDEKTREIEGVDSIGTVKINEFVTAPKDCCKPMPSFREEFLDVVNREGKADHLLLLHIEATHEQVVRTNNDSTFLRMGDRTKELKGDDLRNLEYSKGIRVYEDECNPDASMDDLDKELLHAYCEILQAGDLPYEQQYAIYEDLWQGDGSDGCVIERPKMLYNSKTKKYVIWFHADGTTPSSKGQSNYGKAKAGIAISDSPVGPFKLLGSYLLVQDDKYDHTWDNIGGHVRDMNLFQDDDGTAYVIYSSDGNTNTYIVKLNEEYTNISKSDGNNPIEGIDYIVTFIKNSREAPALFKANNKYYMITSGCTGWNPNPAEYAISDNILGEWKIIGNPCTDEGSSTTYDTQSTCVYK